jgi:hypothetical protein
MAEQEPLFISTATIRLSLQKPDGNRDGFTITLEGELIGVRDMSGNSVLSFKGPTISRWICLLGIFLKASGLLHDCRKRVFHLHKFGEDENFSELEISFEIHQAEPPNPTTSPDDGTL